MNEQLPNAKEDNLIAFIRQKEQKERKKRIQRSLLLATLILSSLAFGAYKWWEGQQQKDPIVELRHFQVESLTRSQVASLFEQDPSPILVEDKGLARTDTIKSVQDYLLLLTAMRDAAKSISTQEVGQQVTETSVTFSSNESPTWDSTANAQIIDTSKPLTQADVMPAFPGGEAALYRFLSSQIRYPESALRNKVEGKVFVRFVIQADGSLTDLKVIRGIGHGCDEEALRVIRMMPKWIPGELGGTKVPVFSSLAVNFKFL